MRKTDIVPKFTQHEVCLLDLQQGQAANYL